jgi:hypothetical protein
VLLVVEAGHAQPESLLERLVGFLGLASNPTEMKGLGDELHTGEIWIADLTTGRTTPVATNGRYRSPIVLPDGSILALRGEAIVRFSGNSGDGSVLQTVQGINKLVGVNANDPGRVLAVIESGAGRPMPAILSLDDGSVSLLPINWNSEDDIRTLAHLRGWERDYGDMTVSVQRVQASGFGGTREWQDVFLVRPGKSAVNVTSCDGIDCGQPSLSPDRSRIVFIKGEMQ